MQRKFFVGYGTLDAGKCGGKHWGKTLLRVTRFSFGSSESSRGTASACQDESKRVARRGEIIGSQGHWMKTTNLGEKKEDARMVRVSSQEGEE
jgi:hypothetical protein